MEKRNDTHSQEMSNSKIQFGKFEGLFLICMTSMSKFTSRCKSNTTKKNAFSQTVYLIFIHVFWSHAAVGLMTLRSAKQTVDRELRNSNSVCHSKECPQGSMPIGWLGHFTNFISSVKTRSLRGQHLQCSHLVVYIKWLSEILH